MKAIVTTQYGSPDVLELKEVEIPLLNDRDMLVRVHATSVTAADGMMRRGKPFYGRAVLGWMRPKNPIPGAGFAGEVVGLGKEVSGFHSGDKVFGETGVHFGAYAEYLRILEDGLIASKPEGLSFEEAATICDGPLTAFNFLQEIAHLQEGQKVLINGASGSQGTAAVQIAKHFGAHVTAVCSTANIEMVQLLGAEEVIDYTTRDFTKNGVKYDIIYDTVGKRSFTECKNSLTQSGCYICPVLRLSLLFQMLRTSIAGGKKAKFSATGLQPVPKLKIMLKHLIGFFEGDKMQTVIDRQYALEEAADAHRYVDEGHKKGNVVIQLNHHQREKIGVNPAH